MGSLFSLKRIGLGVVCEVHIDMSSKIFAIAHIGRFNIYVGTTEQLKTRWEVIERQLERGQYPHVEIQAAWRDSGSDCRFTFRTAQDIAENPDALGLHQFVDDLCEHSSEALDGSSNEMSSAQAS